MKHRRFATATTLGVCATFALAACSSSPGNTNPTGTGRVAPTADGSGKTITVWVMDGDYSTETLDTINAEFTEATEADVDIQIQSWDDITTKITTALATSSPPDVLDVGNTQVASFAANGGLADLTSYAAELAQGQTWLSGLEAPATVDGKLYGVPGFAGARAVIYNKTMWADAGVTAAPKTYDEFVDDLRTIKAANDATDFSPLWFPGRNWYAGMQFVWDAGGEIATLDGDTWVGGLSTSQAQQGLADYVAFQNEFSVPASQTVDTVTPDQVQLFADRKTSAIVATAGYLGRIKSTNPDLTDDDLGTFPFPGKSGDTQPVMLGGSVWSIAARAQNADLALQWIKIAASPDIQDTWIVDHEGFIPNSQESIEAAQVSPLMRAFFDAALNSRATPASANWTTIEGSKDIDNLFTAIASGSKTPKAAAADFDSIIADTLN